MASRRSAQGSTNTFADELARLARSLEPLNGEGRSAAVWRLGDRPALLYAGPHADKRILDAADGRLAQGHSSFEVEGEPGVRGKVIVCGNDGERAAYGLFLDGAGRPHLETTVHGLIQAAERSIGKPVANMSREEKQQVVRFLDTRGAFLIRKAVEDVAERLGVTRFTIYNYLDREEH
jgi:hypothetical protein